MAGFRIFEKINLVIKKYDLGKTKIPKSISDFLNLVWSSKILFSTRDKI